jgi:hypothetical protein
MGDDMQAVSGFARKYAIMGELDQGFGTGSSPEAFVRLDVWEGRIIASVHVKGLKQGPYQYMLYLIFTKGDQLVPIPVGAVNTTYTGMQNGLEIDPDTLRINNLKPEWVKYAAITAENNEKKWIPLFSCFEKTQKWDENIRQVLLKKAIQAEPAMVPEQKPEGKRESKSEAKLVSLQESGQELMQPVENKDGLKNILEKIGEKKTSEPAQRSMSNDNYPAAKSVPEAKPAKCDTEKLEILLKNNFEASEPFKGGNKGYTWYQVNDLAKLSNIMYLTGLNVPVFANPKILVGLFRYKHILAGLYRGENYPDYFVIGVPARDDKDNRPFENACRWVSMSDPTIRDMGGYWLVYVSMRTGEIVV